jgi:steroid 5-alpha reductase family enzyme
MKIRKVLCLMCWLVVPFVTDAFSTIHSHGDRLKLLRGGNISIRHQSHLPMAVESSTLFNNSNLYQSLGIYTVTNAVGLLISLLTGSHKHLDLLGSGSFALATIPMLLASSCHRVLLSSAAVAIWGSKLAGFLCFRAFKLKRDDRLEEMLSSVQGAIQFWVISLVWNVICSLPHILGTTSSKLGSPITLSVGTVVYTLGLLTETRADIEKWIFKHNNPGKFCNIGLWSVSQHPNFFGNIVLWLGILVMNSDSLIEPFDTSVGIFHKIWGCRRLVLSCLSPLFMWTLFNGQARGKVTNSVQLATEKYGKDPAYVNYIGSTPLIIPGIASWLKTLFCLKRN